MIIDQENLHESMKDQTFERRLHVLEKQSSLHHRSIRKMKRWDTWQMATAIALGLSIFELLRNAVSWIG